MMAGDIETLRAALKVLYESHSKKVDEDVADAIFAIEKIIYPYTKTTSNEDCF